MHFVRRSTVLGTAALVASLAVTTFPASAASSPRTSRVSTATDGHQADGASSAPAISADGRYVAFVSAADDLVPGDRNGTADVFVKDVRTGRTQRVADGPASDPALSGDGRYVVFATAAALVKDDDNGVDDVYLLDRRTHRTERISTGRPTSWMPNSMPAISADGRTVAYVTSAPDAAPGDTNERADVIVHDRRTGKNQLVQYTTAGVLADADALFPSLSADGRYVTFDTPALLDPDHADVSKTRLVYLRDLRTQTTELISRPTGYAYKNYADASSISGSGRLVAFESGLYSLVPDDTNKAADVFVYDRAARTTVRVSTAADGTQADGPSDSVSLSANGRYAAFTSAADNLVPGDTNGVADIFLKDLRTGAVERVSLTADGGQADGPSDAVSLSTTGRAAFSSAATNLVPGDTNSVADVFVRHLR
ncbi:PD40 domain-containing protein [Streptomyces sp. TLI_185]|uniref:PD40 domain-containing protein n=1 Tax=Streptomyces sp. TLI_185 TaxID=2485151 RepID=UPI000F4EE569|nr:PD40 domain-containing protein [Streptomyces sp. TLI_185]RPF36512.1 WD40 repeat protein [Streptomyces sp. TLI_185]